MSRTAAILLAAGQGRRMQAAVADKILVPLAGRPVFAHSAAAFVASGVADFYVIVYRDSRQSLELSCYAPTPALFVKGGRERQDSVINALAALPDDIHYVFIHDCARPLVRPEHLSTLLRMVRRDDAAALAHRVVDTIKQIAASRSPAEPIRSRAPVRERTATLDRTRLWAMETPQVFARDLIVRAYAQVQRRRWRITDDVQAVERAGGRVSLLENQHPNPKLTSPEDLVYLEFLLSRVDSPFV
ncbi:MAG TPA: 2-C-methyl-D-erythritol 4-phosphate cytidylyltransferase [Opitutaceae bacterium]|nr:2-C-methyl-D-erythritol 4-phosphate cytidylyltransferase [Opitutaceae bacterium]